MAVSIAPRFPGTADREARRWRRRQWKTLPPAYRVFTSHISRQESDGILDFLYEHMISQKYLVRYHWTDGNLGFWDNPATMHVVIIDYGTQHRLIQRVTLKG